MMGRLRKSDVEALLDDYDADPVGALADALRHVLDRPDATWQELLTAAPIDTARRTALLAGDTEALDELVRELNEQRTLQLDPPQPHNHPNPELSGRD